MALIECADCGRQHSDQAKACPNCGRPKERAWSIRWGNVGTLGGAIFFLGMFAVIWYAVNSVLSEAGAPLPVLLSLPIAAIIFALLAGISRVNAWLGRRLSK